MKNHKVKNKGYTCALLYGNPTRHLQLFKSQYGSVGYQELWYSPSGGFFHVLQFLSDIKTV